MDGKLVKRFAENRFRIVDLDEIISPSFAREKEI